MPALKNKMYNEYNDIFYMLNSSDGRQEVCAVDIYTVIALWDFFSCFLTCVIHCM